MSGQTLRGWMIAEGLWTDRRHRLPSPHQPRQRRECLGELVQIDGSEYAWFEDRGPARTSSFSIILISTAGSVLSTGRLPANHPVSQPNPIAVVGGHGILGGSLRGSDLPGDLVGGLGGLVGEVFTPPATTAKPLPASPRAASIVAFSASRLVCHCQRTWWSGEVPGCSTASIDD